MTEKEIERIGVHQKMIGKTVKVYSKGEEFFAELLEVLDPNTFLARKGTMLVKLDIFDIRETK